MFPMEFAHSVLDSLPLPLEADVTRVVQVLKAIVGRRVIPYFKKKRGTDPLLASRVEQGLRIERLEDNENRIRAVSFMATVDQGWVINVHERVFDYLAFVIPGSSEAALRECSPEAGRMLAFAEFMLRHEIQHILYPASTESEVLLSDAAFAMDQRANDPTFYKALSESLADELNGLRAEPFRILLDHAARGEPLDEAVSQILNDYSVVLSDLPEVLVQKVFPTLSAVLKSRVLGLCFQTSRDTSCSLLKRTLFLQKFLRLFELLMDGDQAITEEVFESFKQRWGLVYLLHELGLTEASLENRSNSEVLELIKQSLKQFSEETKDLFCGAPATPKRSHSELPASKVPIHTLKDRIEEARNDPFVPFRVLELIEKNQTSALGHSGSKYGELIETLLAVPWGKARQIRVSPMEFEEGLNRTHYGLAKPKETIVDFFSSLIWSEQRVHQNKMATSQRIGSAFLFVGPPGVGKTSFAISIAESLGIPYHKLSLGGMRDEADLRGHGFTYEGSKPGAIVQGLIKMECLNGVFIMDEADKVDKFAVATLLEILDPEQNHLFHDKYTQTTVDIDLSGCHFILTANTLETVPPAVVNRCEVVFLDRYSVDEKIAIARERLIDRVRSRYQVTEEQIAFDPEHKSGLLRFLIKAYTREPGVRELERVLRTLFMRILRKEILTGAARSVSISRQKILDHLELPREARRINEEDRIGEVMALGINVEMGVGSVIPVQATPIHLGAAQLTPQGFLSMIHATGNIERVMDESRRVATTAILHCSDQLGIPAGLAASPIHLHFMGGSTPKDGPSAGAAIALALASVLSGRPIRRDIAVTGEIDTQGRITMVGGLDLKLETAYDAGCRTMIIPKENLYGDGGVERLSEALKQELQVLTYDEWKEGETPFDYTRKLLQIVAVSHISEAAEVALIDERELDALESSLVPHARSVIGTLAAYKVSHKPASCLLYVKDSKELEVDGLHADFWETNESVLLVKSVSKEAIGRTVPALAQQKRLREYDPVFHDVAGILSEITDHLLQGTVTPVNQALVAPYFFLQRERQKLEEFRCGSPFRDLRLFANNFAAQGIKVRGCKPALNRVLFHLSHLGPDQLETCPFLKMREGIQVIDISFIPEKYRLDLDRAERILTKSLIRWLTTVEG